MDYYFAGIPKGTRQLAMRLNGLVVCDDDSRLQVEPQLREIRAKHLNRKRYPKLTKGNSHPALRRMVWK